MDLLWVNVFHNSRKWIELIAKVIVLWEFCYPVVTLILLELAAHQHANEVKGHNLGKYIAFISLIFIQVVEGQLAMA